MAMAVYGMGVVLAPAIGPVLGGWLTDAFGWPWIFYVNVPFCVVGMFLISAFVSDPPYLRRGVERIDWTGIGLLTLGLTGLQVVFERGESENWFESDFILVASVVTAVALTLLVLVELRVRHPVLDFRILRNVPLAVGSSMGLIFGIALFGSTFILPQFTQEMLGYTALDAGLVLLPRALVLFFVMPVVGRLYGKVDSRLLVGGGVIVLYLSFLQLSGLSLTAGFWTMVPMLVVMGLGMPFMFVTLTTVSLSTVPKEDMTEASSIYTLARRVGGNIAYALVATVISHRVQFHRTRLAEHLTVFEPGFMDQLRALAGQFTRMGFDPHGASRVSLAAMHGFLNRQSAMLAFNDASLVLGGLLLLTIPLILLLPGLPRKKASSRR